MKKDKKYRFILTGGGTGGHIYPAVAVANEIKRKYPDADVLFVGAKGKMEMTKVPEAGYKIIGLWISGIQRRLTIDNAFLPLKMMVSYLAAKRIIRKFKPDAVMGFGGYASGPVMLAANSMKVPAFIQEQNSYAGMANKFLSKKVKAICVAYEGMEAYFPKEKLKFTGNPVRSDIQGSDDQKLEALKYFKLNKQRKTVLVIGGSLGARTLNNAVLNGAELISEHTDVQFLWQSGSFYYQSMKKKLKESKVGNITLLKFIKRMNMAYAAADIVVSRAGALSVSELCLVGKPVILVPSPNVAEDHQTKNAKALEGKNAAVLVRDADAYESLVKTALELLKDDQKSKALQTGILNLAKPNAAQEIVEVMEAYID